MFVTMFLSIWTGLHIYVFWRAASVPLIKRHLSRKLLIPLAVVLWSSFLLPRFFDNSGSNAISRPLELLGANWLGILFLVFSSLLVVDIVTACGFLFRPYAPRLRGAALLAGAVLSVIALVQGNRPPVVQDYEIYLADLPPEADNLTIVAISDLHLGTLLGEPWLTARVTQVNALQPDLIVLLGDIVEGHGQSDNGSGIQLVLRRLAAPLGVWAVTGNHERHGGIDSGVRLLMDAGIKVLRDQWSAVRPGLILAGIDDLSDSRIPDSGVNRIRQALAGRPAHTATIFLSHRPQGVEVAADAGVGLMLSAHTHGGQIWPFSYIAGLVNPLLAGRYEVRDMPVVVCRGTGTWGPRMRLWSPSEIIRITLRSAQATDLNSPK
ncbi:metallophosphoesterase [Candidatus Zixiibacteriota bacterium]